MSTWHAISSGRLPHPETAVLAWNCTRQQPEVVFLDPDDGAWQSQVDGDEVDAAEISHWAVDEAPGRETVGGAS